MKNLAVHLSGRDNSRPFHQGHAHGSKRVRWPFTMSDNKEDRGPADRSRINVNEDYEVRYWTKELGVSEDRLRELVKAVGPSADKIREALKSS
jgi:hypothetical protein